MRMTTFTRVFAVCFGIAAVFAVSCAGGNGGSANGTNTSSTGSSGDGDGDGDGDGGDPEEPFVDNCGGLPCCDTDDDCSGTTPRCGEISNCVECTGPTEEEDCGDYSCAHREGVCTDRLGSAKEVCFSCQRDTDCRYPMNCVVETFAGQELLPVCIYMQTRADYCPRGHGYPREANSVDGVTGTHCFPPPTTTCQAIYERNVASCESHDECGAEGLDDGYCDSGTCTILCMSTDDCTDCSGDPAYCH